MTQHSAPQKEWRKQRTSAELILPQKESKHTDSIKYIIKQSVTGENTSRLSLTVPSKIRALDTAEKFYNHAR